MDRRRFLSGSAAAAFILAGNSRRSFAAILGPSAAVDADINALSGDGAELTLKRAAVSPSQYACGPGAPYYVGVRRQLAR